MINEKTQQIAKTYTISQDIAFSLLIKHNWDTSKLDQKFMFGNQSCFAHLAAEYKFVAVEAIERKEENKAEQEFMCSCCYCDYEREEIVEMPDCGHRLCMYCF